MKGRREGPAAEGWSAHFSVHAGGENRTDTVRLKPAAQRVTGGMRACGRGGLTLCIGNGLGVRRSEVAARRCAPDAGAVSEMRMCEKARSGGAAIAPSGPALCTVICAA